MCLVITDVTQHLIRIRDDRRTLVRTHRCDLLHHSGDLHRVLNDNLSCLCGSQIFEFLQHLISRPKIQWRLTVRITESLPCHDDPSVYLILRIHEMYITCSDNRLIEPFAKCHDLPVDLF